MKWKTNKTWYTNNFIYRMFCKHTAKVFDEVMTAKDHNTGIKKKAHCQRCNKVLDSI